MYVSSSSSFKFPMISKQSLMGGSTNEHMQGGAKTPNAPTYPLDKAKTATIKGPALPGRVPRQLMGPALPGRIPSH